MKHREAGPSSGSLILRTSDRPLRIAHVVNEPFGFESASGVQQVIHCLSTAQAELGHAVAVFSRDDNAVTFLGAGGEIDVSGFRGQCRPDLRSRSANVFCLDISNTHWLKMFWPGNRTSSTFIRFTFHRMSFWRRICVAQESRTA